MKLPVIQGTIRRRMLVNFRVDPEVIQKLLPDRMQPKLHAGYAVAGICLIRLEHVRPRHIPAALGIASENAAHRVAVLWDDEAGTTHEGVYIWRRDTGSVLNHLAGGRIFPGEHHKASFDVTSTAAPSPEHIDLKMRSDDGDMRIEVSAHVGDALASSSHFGSLEDASQFFAHGSVGFSVTSDPHRLDGIRLATSEWKVEPLAIDRWFSSYFSDESRFPRGSIELDCGLLMRDIEHEWHEEEDLYV
jgi:hypothetical protein